jgi:Protein of unknown function (DUF4054)
MAITTIMPPTIAEFRAAFPEFASASDDQVQMAIDTAMTWVDVWWFWPDAKLAVMYAAAHYLWLHDKASGGLITGGGGSGGGTPPVIDSEAGLIWVKSVRFRDRSVTYDRVSGAAGGESSKTEHITSSSEDFWNSSPYGQLYLSFRRRNVPHVAVI